MRAEMSWILARHQRERLLAESEPRVWSDLRSIVERNVEDYRTYFAESMQLAIQCERIGDDRIRVRSVQEDHLLRTRTERTVTIESSGGQAVIAATYSGPFLPASFDLPLTVEDGEVKLKISGSVVSLVDASEKILTPILFPKQSA